MSSSKIDTPLGPIDWPDEWGNSMKMVGYVTGPTPRPRICQRCNALAVDLCYLLGELPAWLCIHCMQTWVFICRSWPEFEAYSHARHATRRAEMQCDQDVLHDCVLNADAAKSCLLRRAHRWIEDGKEE